MQKNSFSLDKFIRAVIYFKRKIGHKTTYKGRKTSVFISTIGV